MSEMPGIEIPAVPPGGVARVRVADLDAGTITDLATGRVERMPARVCAYLPSEACQCDDPAQCPVLRDHPAEAAAAWAASNGTGPVPRENATEQVGNAREAPAAAGRPVLLHSGNYGLYRTPEGLYHLVYQRTAGTNPDTGEVTAIDGAPQIHARDLPERAAQMVAAVMDRDTPLPPMIESLIFGGGKPPRTVVAMMKAAGMDISALGADDAAE